MGIGALRGAHRQVLPVGGKGQKGYSSTRLWVGAKHAHKQRMLLQKIEGFRNGDVLYMPLKVYIEEVLPWGAAGRPCFNHREVHIVLLEGVKRVGQLAGSIGHGKDEGGFVFTGGFWLVVAQHQKARTVRGVVFDMFTQDG